MGERFGRTSDVTDNGRVSDQQQPSAERPVLNGLVALIAVALGVGAVLAGTALFGSKALGLGDGGGTSGGGAAVQQSMYLPTPVETVEASGPLVTLHTQDTEQPLATETPSSDDTDPSDDESESESPSGSPGNGEISLQALATTVTSGERIYFSGVYPGGEGAILFVQRWQDDAWTDFPASVGVTNGTFSSYIFTGLGGVNRFRVVDRDRDVYSNEISVTVN